MSSLEATLAIATSSKRVCPMPPTWQSLYKLLPDTRQVGNGWQPPLPLILAGWDFSTDHDKRVRLREHIQWASEHGALPAVHDFLLALPADKWHCEDSPKQKNQNKAFQGPNNENSTPPRAPPHS